MNPSLESIVTISQLLRTMEKTDSQSVTLFRNGTGHFVMGRFSAPAFHSLPELSKFVAEINARPDARAAIPSPGGEGQGEGGLLNREASTTPSTQTANAS